MNLCFNFNDEFSCIVLISANPIVYFLIDSLRQNNYSGKIILVEDKNRILSEVPDSIIDRRLTIDPEKIEDIIPIINSHKSPLVCVVSWYKIFSRNFINAFNSRILNVHTGDLPNYRGAGGGSWQVLNGEEKIHSHVQQLIFEVDRGPILFSELEVFPNRPYPKDVKAAAMLASKRVLIKLALAIVKKELIELTVQNEQVATYFPRLNTSLNGWINFSWNVEFVERFVRAFSYPFAGASFNYLGETFRVKESWTRESNINFHPFCHGLITNIDQNSIHVICNGGIICLSELYGMDENPVSVKKFKLGKNLSADINLLKKSSNL